MGFSLFFFFNFRVLSLVISCVLLIPSQKGIIHVYTSQWQATFIELQEQELRVGEDAQFFEKN